MVDAGGKTVVPYQDKDSWDGPKIQPGVGEYLGPTGGKFFAGVALLGRGKQLPTLKLDAQRMPGIARNVETAQAAGHPAVLHREMRPKIIDANRKAACEGFCGPGSPDEYPFASTVEGGAGARVTAVPLAEQRIQGGVMSQFYRQHGIKQGDAFRVVVKKNKD
jgi:hypothetical protein